MYDGIFSRKEMEVTQCDGVGRTTESLISLLTLRTRNGVNRVAGASVYRLDITLRELTTAQAYLLTMFDALLADDAHTCSLLLELAANVEQLRSPYLEVWLREDFNFEKDQVRKVLIALDKMELNIPGHILRVFAGLTEKYGPSRIGFDAFHEAKTNGLFGNGPIDEIGLEALPELEIPVPELEVAKRCLGLPSAASAQEVKQSACKKDIEGYDLLHRFAEAGHALGVQELLAIGVPVDHRGPGGSLAIHYAAEYGQLQVMPLLLRAGCNPSAPKEDGNTPIHLAASMGNVVTVEWLAEHGANLNAKNCKGQTPLHVAAAANHTAVLETLIDLEAEQRRIEGTRLGAIPRGLGSLDPRDIEGCTPLHLAARANNLEAVKLLLKRGADLNSLNDEGLSPLNEATLWGAVQVELLLLELGADKRGRRR